MPYYQFDQDDIINNTLVTHPKAAFFVYGGVVYYNEHPFHAGDLSTENINHVPPGFVSLYEYNIDRPDGGLIYPFTTKGGSLTSFRTITSTSFNSDYAYGDVMSGSYPLSASIT